MKHYLNCKKKKKINNRRPLTNVEALTLILIYIAFYNLTVMMNPAYLGFNEGPE